MSLDKMMKSIVQSEIMSSHPEVKKFFYEGPRLTSTSTLNSLNGRLPSEASASSLNMLESDLTLGSTERQLTPSDFTYVMQIGKGSFGRVYLATMNGRSDNKYYAIKAHGPSNHEIFKNQFYS